MKNTVSEIDSETRVYRLYLLYLIFAILTETSIPARSGKQGNNIGENLHIYDVYLFFLQDFGLVTLLEDNYVYANPSNYDRL